MEIVESTNVYAYKLITKKDYFAPGHRACQGCAEALAVRLVAKALGRNVIVASATGCMEIISSPMPFTSWRVPWIHVAFENAAAVASGAEAGMKVLMRKGRVPKRKITFLAMAGDGGTSDIGVQALSGALERGHDFIYICYDNEAYMNTGIQRSSSTPYGASTTTSPAGKVIPGQITWKKNMPEIAVAHNIPYVATACPSYPIDLVEKVNKAARVKGPAYIHILSVCPTGWRLAPELSIRAGRLAVETGVFPLYEVEYGRYRFTEEYLKIQGRFRHLSEEMIDTIQKRVVEEYEKLEKKIKMTEGD
ncbi:MAG: pyruvate ferredoxin oxidoreductase [Deltaproteobacteria bacterium]|nr:pyruvate ferredoxin oxidoreductase [Deltaproteobacteria bacterium]